MKAMEGKEFGAVYSAKRTERVEAVMPEKGFSFAMVRTYRV
jgi:hypothetical protein